MASFIWPTVSFQENSNGNAVRVFSSAASGTEQEDNEDKCKLHKKPGETVHMSTTRTCTSDDRSKLGNNCKRAIAVRWTSFPETTTGSVEQKDIVKKTTSTKPEDVTKEDTPKKTAVSPSTAVNRTSFFPVDNDAHEWKPLSLENLLSESQQQFTELVWCRRLCRAQQAALDAAYKRQETLQGNISDLRATLSEMKEHHRAYVAGTAGELRQAKASLLEKEDAVRVLKEEVDKLRVENKRLCVLNRQVDAERVRLGLKQSCIEDELALLLEKKKALEQEVKKFQTFFEEPGSGKHVVRQQEKTFLGTTIDSKGMEKDQNILCGVDKNIFEKKEEENKVICGDDCCAKRDDCCRVKCEFHRTLCERKMEANAADEFARRLQKEWQENAKLAYERLYALGKRITRLTTSLYPSEQISSLNEYSIQEDDEKKSHEENIQALNVTTAAFIDCVVFLELQWGRLEEVVALRRHESEQQQRQQWDELKKLEDLHVAEMQKWQSVAQELTKRLRRTELVCNKFMLAMEHQRQIAIAATRVGIQDQKKIFKQPNDRRKTKEKRQKELKAGMEMEGGVEMEAHLDMEMEMREEVDSDVRSDCELEQMLLREDCEEEKTTAEEQEQRLLEKCGLSTTVTASDSLCDRSVQLLVRRTHLATRQLARQLWEMRMRHDAVVARTYKERQRHTSVVQRLRALLKTAEDALESLRTQLAAVTQSADTERTVLQRRVEAAERSVGAKEKEGRQRLRQLNEALQGLQAARHEVALREELIVTLKEELIEQSNTTRETNFDISTLRRRCDDLLKMMDALELQVQRETLRQNVLYETVRQLCGVVTLLALRVRGVAAERNALLRAYDAQWYESHLVLQRLQEFVREEDKEDKNTEGVIAENNFFDKMVHMPHCFYVRCSLYKVAVLVLACCRMKRLVRCRCKKRHVVFVMNSSDGCTHGYEKSDCHNNSETLNLVWRRMAPNSLLSLLSLIPLVSTLLNREENTTLVPTIELPPLQTLVDIIGTNCIGDAVEVSKDTLQELMAVTLLNTSAKFNQFYGLVDNTPARPPRHVALTAVQRPTHSMCASVQTLESFLGLMRQRFHKLREKCCQQQASIKCVKAENLKLSDALKENEQLYAELAQNLHDYENKVAETCVGRDVYKELQRRLTLAHDALQEERKARRTTEEANVALLKQEVELTRKVEEMRGELRFLKIERTEQEEKYRNQEPQIHCGFYGSCDNNHDVGNIQRSFLSNSVATSLPSTVFQGGIVNNSCGQTDTLFYAHQHAGPMAESSSPPSPLSPSAHTINANSPGDIDYLEKKDDWRIILDLKERFKMAGGDWPQQTMKHT